jgi:predicted nucleic acid-binding protein
MSDKIVDASALAAVLFDEAASASVASRLQTHVLHAPQLLRYELINICWKKARKVADAALLYEGLAGFDRADIELHEVDTVAVAQLAVTTGLTGYDASYLWLARALGAELVTLDERLAAVAMARS